MPKSVEEKLLLLLDGGYDQGVKDANTKAAKTIAAQAEEINDLKERVQEVKDQAQADFKEHYDRGFRAGSATGDRKYTVTFLPMGRFQSEDHEIGLRISVIGTIRRANAQNLLGLKEAKDLVDLDPNIHRIQIHNLTLAEAFSLYQFLLPKNLQPVILEGLSC